MRLTGYMEFDVLINVKMSNYQNVVEKIYHEFENI